MGSMLQDLRYGWRTLLKSPGFTAVAVITLALGIGANSAIFSVVNAVVLKPLPFHDSERLVLVLCNELSKGVADQGASPPDFRALREQSRSFDNLSAYYGRAVNLTGTTEAQQLDAQIVSFEFFTTLGITPALGRTFLRNEEQWGSHHVVMISNPFWKTHFGSRRNLSDMSLRLDGEQYSVIGVLPEGFRVFSEKQLWMPMAWAPGDVINAHNSYFLRMIGRLKSGVTQDQASADSNSTMARIAAQFPENKGIGADLKPLRDAVVGDVRPALLILMGRSDLYFSSPA